MATKVQNDLTLLNQSTQKEKIDVRVRAMLLALAVLASLGLLYWQVQNTALLVAFLPAFASNSLPLASTGSCGGTAGPLNHLVKSSLAQTILPARSVTARPSSD